MDRYYQSIAPDYVRQRRVHPELLRDLIASGNLSPASNIADIGCGTGNYLRALRESVGCHCCGVDRSEAMLAEARRQLSGVQLVRASAEQTGLPNAYFDLVLLVDVVHHLTDRLRTLRECLRILRPSGKLCIATESAELIRRREPHASYFPEAIDIELARYPALEILKSQLASAGFDKVQEQMLEFQTELTDIEPYRTKAHSSLQLISESGFAAGIDRLERDLRAGPIPYTWRYLLLSAAKPGGD